MVGKADHIFETNLRCKIVTALEHAAVNRRVVGSSPTGGAKDREIFNLYVAFLFGRRYIKDSVEYLFFVIISRRFAFVKSFLDNVPSE